MTVPLRSDLLVPDLCASAFSVSLRDQCSVYPSIVAGDRPLNGSRRGRGGAEHAEEQSKMHGSSGLTVGASRTKCPLRFLTEGGGCHATRRIVR